MNIEEIIKLFKEKGFITETEKKLLIVIYSFQECKATAPQLAQILGYSHFAPVNSIAGKLGKKIADKINFPLRERYNGSFAGWDVIFWGENSEKGFLWTLKDEIKKAIEILNWIEYDNIPEEVNLDLFQELKEGAIKTISVNAYERNPIARKICLLKFGHTCFVCGFDFEKFYGQIGKDFIHVHHIKPLSEIGKEYRVDPENDMIPVCPNCHAMIHHNKETIEIKELKNSLLARHGI